jgi:hypothetical protein
VCEKREEREKRGKYTVFVVGKHDISSSANYSDRRAQSGWRFGHKGGDDNI